MTIPPVQEWANSLLCPVTSFVPIVINFIIAQEARKNQQLRPTERILLRCGES
jgi:hypothetical protein